VGNQRSAIAMTADEARAFLGEQRTLILATIGPDGVPDPVPMWFVLDGEVLWMRTYAKSQKVRNIERDQRVSILVETGERYAELRGFQASGPIELSRDIDRICDVFVGLMIKYEGLDPQFADDARTGYRATAAKQVAMACRWSDSDWSVASWDHRKQAGG
jgi:PPOX class probable F420-dependent enzyme